MMKTKQTLLALAATGMLAGPALAAEGLGAEVPTQAAAGTLPAELPELPAVLALTPPEPFSAADMQALFVPSHEPLRVAVLSPQEMEETQGALAPFAVGGLVGGAWQGATFAWGAHRGHHQWNTSRFVGNVATGALIGAGAGHMRFVSSGIAGIRNLRTPGGAIWAGNAAVANTGANFIWRR